MRWLGAWGDGNIALQEMSALKPNVVLMDINMPGISGIECTARLKQLCPNVQIIMVTVYNDSENVFHALQAGACGYLLKRTSAAGIIEAINDVRNGGAPITSEIARKLVQAFQSPVNTKGSDIELTQREREILKPAGPRFHGQKNRGRFGHQLSHGEGSRQKHLREAPHPLPCRGSYEICQQ